MITLATVAGHQLACALPSTNDVVATLKDADARLLLMHEIRDEAVKLEEAAPANQWNWLIAFTRVC